MNYKQYALFSVLIWSLLISSLERKPVIQEKKEEEEIEFLPQDLEKQKKTFSEISELLRLESENSANNASEIPEAPQKKNTNTPLIKKLKFPLANPDITSQDTVDINNISDSIAAEVLSELIKEQTDQGLFFILARVVTNNKGKHNIEYYEANGINKYLFKDLWSTNPAIISANGMQTPQRVPIEGCVYYYIIGDPKEDFEFLCSDQDLNKGERAPFYQNIFLANYALDKEKKIKAQDGVAGIYTQMDQFTISVAKKLDIKKDYSKAERYAKLMAKQNIDKAAKEAGGDYLIRIHNEYLFSKNSEDSNKAKKIGEFFVEQNFPVGNFILGLYYFKINNYDKSFEYYHKAFLDKNLSPELQSSTNLKLAELYYLGHGTPKNLGKAKEHADYTQDKFLAEKAKSLKYSILEQIENASKHPLDQKPEPEAKRQKKE